MERICYGVELEPKFVDVAVKRYMAAHNDSTDGIVLLRDGKEMTYEQAVAAMEVPSEVSA